MKITNYDEHYNRRERIGRNKLPPLRRYNTHKMGWDPEVSQNPIIGILFVINLIYLFWVLFSQGFPNKIFFLF